MKPFLFFHLLLAFCLSGCSDSDTEKDLTPFMVDVKQFRIDTSALKDGEKVEILGASGNLTQKHKIDFYNLIVVRSLESGDTVNVLVTNFFQPTSNPETVFMSNISRMGKLMESAEQLEEGVDVDEISSKKFSKVFYDTEFIEIDVRKYPSVTGNLGNYKIEGDL